MIGACMWSDRSEMLDEENEAFFNFLILEKDD